MFGAIDTKSHKLKEIVRKKSLDQFIWQIEVVENYHVMSNVFFFDWYSDWYENLDAGIIGGRRSVRWVMASLRYRNDKRRLIQSFDFAMELLELWFE